MALVVNGQGKWGILPTPSDFISTWKTDNTSSGSSTATQIKLPLVSTGTYNFVVDWGDGTTSTITTWNAAATTHTYATAGTYTVKIKGICTGWQFNNGGDRLKMLSVSSWGKFKLGTTQGSYFYGCTNLNLSGVTDVLDLAGTTNLAWCFYRCTSLTTIGRLNEWNLVGVTDISAMFRGATLFNQNIGSWNTASVTTMLNTFETCTNFNNGLASGIAGTLAWNTAAVTTMQSMFYSAKAFNCNVGSWNVSACANFNGTFNDASKFNNGGSPDINNWVLKTTGTINMGGMFQSATIFNQPLSNWNTVAVNNMSTVFYQATAFNNGLASGVGSTLPWNTANVTTMWWMFLNARAFNCDVSSFNTQNVTTMESMFGGATNFNNGLAVGVAGTLAWNTSAVTNMSGMFNYATSFNCNIGSWNVSAVTTFVSMFQSASKFNNGGSDTIGTWVLKTTGTVNMGSMFQSAILFNQPLNGWNTQAVNSMGNLFNGASAFNNGLTSGTAGTLAWNTSAVTTFYTTFYNATSFNCNVGSWNVSLCGDFTSMFDGSSKFNNGGSDTIGNWTLKTTGTINMTYMFARALLFNQPLNGWNTIAVTNINGMFSNCPVFNNGLASGAAGTLAWNTSNVTIMSFSMAASSFNCDISSWDVSKVTDFSLMFNQASKFNQPLNSWVLKTTGTVNMSSMFISATIFNQSLSSWNTIAVTNMSSMFKNAIAFNQDISSFNTAVVTNMNNMFEGCTNFNNGLASGVAGTLAWNTSTVTTMSSMFYTASSFNCNIGSWNVSKVTTFASMFQSASKFNNGGSSDINNWVLKTTGTISMSTMFYVAIAFNQPLNSWNTVAVTNMGGMFSTATAFDQNIGNWNVSVVTDFNNFMTNKTPATFSTTNLDAIYNGWSSRPVLASKSISFGSAKRTAASTAGRAILTNSPNLWTITDGGI
jgi:surface protein